MSLRTESLTEYHARLGEATNGVDIVLWKRIWGLIHAATVLAVGYAAIRLGADPLYMGAITVVLAMAVFTGQVKEIEVANLLTITFKRDRKD